MTCLKSWLLGLIISLTLVIPTTAVLGATRVLTWGQPGAEGFGQATEIERAPMGQGNKCGTFSYITEVPFGVLTYTDSVAPEGWICYRARNRGVFDPGDGTTQVIFSPYSNIDTNKPGKPQNMQVQ